MKEIDLSDQIANSVASGLKNEINNSLYASPSSTMTTTTGSGYMANSTAYPYYTDTGFQFKPTPMTRIAIRDNDGNIKLDNNNIHIQPVNNGFLVTTMTEEEGLQVHVFPKWKDVIDFLGENRLLSIDDNNVADNV